MCAFIPGEYEISEEEADEIIRTAAEKIHLYGMETVAILTLESVKPLVYVGGEMSRVVLAPFLPALGPDIDFMGEKLIQTFGDRGNIEKLIQILEKMARGEYQKPGEAEAPPAEETTASEAPVESEEPPKPVEGRKGWRRWLPF